MSTFDNRRTAWFQSVHLDTVMEDSMVYVPSKQQIQHIRFEKDKGLWVVRVYGNGRYIKVGEYINVKEAIKQYLRACKMYNVDIQKECLNYV